MARFFGTDFISFSTTSGEPYPGISRRFWSLSEAARENGASRILCGIHFSSAVRAGYTQGEQVGGWVFENALRPVKPQPVITTSQVSQSFVHWTEGTCVTMMPLRISPEENCRALSIN